MELRDKSMMARLEELGVGVSKTRVYVISEPESSFVHYGGAYRPRNFTGLVVMCERLCELERRYAHETSHGSYFENARMGMEIAHIDRAVHDLEKELFGGLENKTVHATPRQDIPASRRIDDPDAVRRLAGKHGVHDEFWEVNNKVFQGYLEKSEELQGMRESNIIEIEGYALVMEEELTGRKPPLQLFPKMYREASIHTKLRSKKWKKLVEEKKRDGKVFLRPKVLIIEHPDRGEDPICALEPSEIEELFKEKILHLAHICQELKRHDDEAQFFRKEGPMWPDFDDDFVVGRKKARDFAKELEGGRLLLVGESASGKTVLARSLGYGFARDGYTVYFLKVNELATHSVDPILQDAMKLDGVTPSLLIIDDIHNQLDKVGDLLEDIKRNTSSLKVLLVSRKLPKYAYTEKETLQNLFKKAREIKGAVVIEDVIERYSEKIHGGYKPTDTDIRQMKLVAGENLWLLAYALKAWSPVNNPDKPINMEAVYDEVYEDLNEISKKYGIKGGQQVIDILLVLSPLSRFEISMERTFLTKELNFSQETLDKLVEVGEIKKEENRYLIPHSELAELYWGMIKEKYGYLAGNVCYSLKKIYGDLGLKVENFITDVPRAYVRYNPINYNYFFMQLLGSANREGYERQRSYPFRNLRPEGESAKALFYRILEDRDAGPWITDIISKPDYKNIDEVFFSLELLYSFGTWNLCEEFDFERAIPTLKEEGDLYKLIRCSMILFQMIKDKFEMVSDEKFEEKFEELFEAVFSNLKKQPITLAMMEMLSPLSLGVLLSEFNGRLLVKLVKSQHDHVISELERADHEVKCRIIQGIYLTDRKLGKSMLKKFKLDLADIDSDEKLKRLNIL